MSKYPSWLVQPFVISLSGGFIVSLWLLCVPPVGITVAAACALSWAPAAVFAALLGVTYVRWRLRAPDVVIEVSARDIPLAARFLEQDRRLELRERLKGDLDRVNAEIETFNANMDADTRRAWYNRPGPYGK